MHRAPAILALLLAGAACGGGGTHPHPPPPPEAALLLIGAGEELGSTFTALDDGAELELIPGAQGGFHVYLNVRIDESKMGADVDNVVLDRQARRQETGELVSQAKRRSPLIPSGEARFFQGDRSFAMFLCPTPVGVPVKDQLLDVRIRAFTNELDERPIAEGRLRFRPHCPVGPQAEFCQRICSG